MTRLVAIGRLMKGAETFISPASRRARRRAVVFPQTFDKEVINVTRRRHADTFEAGQAPDTSEWLTRYPELAPDLAEFFAGQEQIAAIGVATPGICCAINPPGWLIICCAIAMPTAICAPMPPTPPSPPCAIPCAIWNLT